MTSADRLHGPEDFDLRPVRRAPRRERAVDAGFHATLVLLGAVNAGLLWRYTEDGRPLVDAGSSWLGVAPAVLWLLLLPFYQRDWVRTATRSRLWQRAPGLQLTGILVVAVGGVSAVVHVSVVIVARLAAGGVAPSLQPPPTDLTVGDAHRQLVWEALDTLPLLEVPGTLGWEAPVADPNWPLGVAGMLARVAVSVFVLWAFGHLVQRVRFILLPRPDEGQPPA